MGGSALAVDAPGGPASAGFWRRSTAAALDCVLGVAVWLVCAAWLVLGLWALGGMPADAEGVLILLIGLLLLSLALRLVYHVAFVGGCGQTLGRMATGLAVVDGRGDVPGYRRALRRCLGAALARLTFGLAALPFLFLRDGRTLGDRVAGTRVVRLVE